MEDNKYSGHFTLSDGSHQAMTSELAEALWKNAQERLKARAERLPDEQSAIGSMFDAFDRLRELGWRDAIYCPKDGTHFQVLEAGSTGIFDAYYDGEWPKGSWWAADDGDLWPSRPILFRLYPEDEARYRSKLEEAARKFREENPVLDEAGKE